MRPFLVSDPDPTFSKIPERHLEKLRKLSNYFVKESLRREREQLAQIDVDGSSLDPVEFDGVAVQKVIDELPIDSMVTMTPRISDGSFKLFDQI